MPRRLQLWLIRLCIVCLVTILCYTVTSDKENIPVESHAHPGQAATAANISALIRERRQVVQEQCSKLELEGKLRSSYIAPENFLTVKRCDSLYCISTGPYTLSRHKLTWCPLYKAGSSNWMRNFVLLAGLDSGSKYTGAHMSSLLAFTS